MKNICVSSMKLNELETFVVEIGQPKFRAKQIYTWLHKHHASSFNQMLNLPKTLIEYLSNNCFIDTAIIEKKQVSKDGTIKYLLKLNDGEYVETVVMQYNHGNSICVSTQVGCKMGCKFCASTQNGLVRNLNAGEIAAQIYTAKKDINSRISNIVLMGIGEPLDNFDNVIKFLRIISSDDGENIGMRNISLSTCGLVPQIKELAKLRLSITLSVSLHAPFDDLRTGMMPINKAYNIKELISACREYQKQTGRRISFEYSLIKGVNDGEVHAKQLASLIKGMGAHVNLIPVNQVDNTEFMPSQEINVNKFKQLLLNLNVNATVRRTLGTDISAACGQLRRDTN